MNEILWCKNIKELLYFKSSSEDFDKIIYELNQTYLLNFKKEKKVWCDFKYLNTCLLLYFSYFKKLNNPHQIFFSLLFKNIVKENSSDSKPNLSLLKSFCEKDREYFICSPSMYTGIKFLLTQEEYCINDVGVTENDFNILHDIILYCLSIKIKPNIWSGLLFDSEHGLSFKYKGTVETEELKNLILPVLDIMQVNVSHFKTPYIKQIYVERILYILDKYPTLKVKGR